MNKLLMIYIDIDYMHMHLILIFRSMITTKATRKAF